MIFTTNPKSLEKISRSIRCSIVGIIHRNGYGNLGGSLSCADILTHLYFREMNVDPRTPFDPNRDRFVMSKYHCSPALYATLAERGYFHSSILDKLGKSGEFPGIHPDTHIINGVDISVVSPASGLSFACGIAMCAKITGEDFRVYAIIGDRELRFGEVWESALFAAEQRLSNLCLIVDNNDFSSEDGVLVIDEKFKAFGFYVCVVDGHNYLHLRSAFECARQNSNKPTVIVARTIKGSGISFMESNPEWHCRIPDERQFRLALSQLGGEYYS